MNKTTKIILGLVVLVIVVALIAVFYKPAPKETVRIGVIFPLTGPVAAFGEQGKNGLEIALGEVKKDLNIELVYEDEKCDAKEAVTAYQKLKDISGVKMIIGAGCSQSTLAIAPLAEKDKIILFTSMSAADTVSEAGDFIFRNHTFARMFMDKMSDFTIKKWKKVVTLYDVKNDNAVLSDKWFKEYFEKAGGSVSSFTVSGSQPTYQTEVLKIKEANADAILLEVYGPKDVAQIIKTLTELGVNKPLLLDYAAATAPEFKTALGDLFDKLEAYIVVPDFSEKNSPEFWVDYKDRFKQDPTAFSAQSYDILKILAYILKDKCRSTDTACIRDNLYKIKDWKGVSGVITIDSNGDATKSLVVKTIKNGQFVPYEE